MAHILTLTAYHSESIDRMKEYAVSYDVDKERDIWSHLEHL